MIKIPFLIFFLSSLLRPGSSAISYVSPTSHFEERKEKRKEERKERREEVRNVIFAGSLF